VTRVAAFPAPPHGLFLFAPRLQPPAAHGPAGATRSCICGAWQRNHTRRHTRDPNCHGHSAITLCASRPRNSWPIPRGREPSREPGRCEWQQVTPENKRGCQASAHPAEARARHGRGRCAESRSRRSRLLGVRRGRCSARTAQPELGDDLRVLGARPSIQRRAPEPRASRGCDKETGPPHPPTPTPSPRDRMARSRYHDPGVVYVRGRAFSPAGRHRSVV